MHKSSANDCYVRKFDDNTTISFKISNKQLLKKYNQIWKNLKSLLNIKLDSEPIYGDNDKYIKTKIKTYGGGVIRNFKGEKMPKEKGPCKSLSIIMLDFVVKTKERYYSQVFLEKCEYEAKEIKMENLIDNDLEKSLSDEFDNEADNDSNDDEKHNDESNE